MSAHPEPSEDIGSKLRLSSPTIYEIISTEGREELARPFQSLAWSATVAGICISFSLFCEGFIKLHTPDAKGVFLLDNLGYSVGFLIVILGRFQLFTENTITVILPLLERFSLYKFSRTMKLWGVVLVFNLLGTFLTALLITHFHFFSPEQFDVFIDISKHAVLRPVDQVFFQAIPAGFLIAALVWMLPSSAGTQFWVIFMMTYLIAVGDFSHVIAGSTESFLLILGGYASWQTGMLYILMAALGNIIGGSGLFALTAYAQVREEMS